jgi:hypothetical protein
LFTFSLHILEGLCFVDMVPRLSASLFGRKTILELDSTVPNPEKIDDKYLLETGTGLQPAEIPSILDAFIVTINIFEVMEGTRKIEYSSLDHSFRLPELTQILQLNERIDEIEYNLPSHLKRDNDDISKTNTPRNRVFKLQAEAVMTRYTPNIQCCQS